MSTCQVVPTSGISAGVTGSYSPIHIRMLENCGETLGRQLLTRNGPLYIAVALQLYHGLTKTDGAAPSIRKGNSCADNSVHSSVLLRLGRTITAAPDRAINTVPS